jgi:hypothetical protein
LQTTRLAKWLEKFSQFLAVRRRRTLCGQKPVFVRESKNKGFINKDKPVILAGDFREPPVKLIAEYESGAVRRGGLKRPNRRQNF